MVKHLPLSSQLHKSGSDFNILRAVIPKAWGLNAQEKRRIAVLTSLRTELSRGIPK